MIRRLRNVLIAFALIVLAIVGAVALQVDNWSRDLTTNRAATSSDASDRSLQTLELSVPVDEVHEAIDRFVDRSESWSHGIQKSDGVDTSDGNEIVVVPLVRTSRLFRFADDVSVLLQPIEVGTRVDVVSQSRIGKGDLGQNPRNILALLQMLRDAFLAPGSAEG